eukprot:737515-Rhodomonas_salina.2
MMNILNLIDLVAILPFYIKLLPIDSSSDNLTVLRVIRLVKVFRIFRFGRYSTGLRLLLFTLQQSRGELSIMVRRSPSASQDTIPGADTRRVYYYYYYYYYSLSLSFPPPFLSPPSLS